MTVFTPRPAPGVLLHAVIWGLLAVLVFTQPGAGLPPAKYYLLQTALFAGLLGVFYVNMGWAVPRLLYRRRLLPYLALLVGLVLAITLAHYGLHRLLRAGGVGQEPAPAAPVLARPAPGAGLPGPGPPPAGRLGPGPGRPASGRGGPGWVNPAVLLASLLVLGLGTSVAAVQRGQRDAQARHALEQEKLAAELELLKAQINPHFLFNTLNNIYALTLLDGEQARAAIHRLSRLLRHVLYESPADRVRLSQEISFLRDYVALMQLRLTASVQLQIELPEHLDADPLIAPMLLQPFVENAFKHGVSASAPSRIYLALRLATDHTVELRVRNTRFPARPAAGPTAAGPAADEPGGGLGLANTRRRLALLYPQAHTLTVTEHAAPAEYEVCLTLHPQPRT